MFNRIKQTVYLTLSLILTSCASASWSTIGVNGVMIEHAAETYDNEMAIDSICRVENLPELNKWKKLDLRSASGDVFNQYVYVMQTDSTETVYTITVVNKNNEFNFVKRDIK